MRLPGKKLSEHEGACRARQPRTCPTAYIRQRCRRSRVLRAYDRGSAWPFRARCHAGLCALGYGARRSGRARLSGDRTNAGRCSGGSTFNKGLQEEPVTPPIAACGRLLIVSPAPQPQAETPLPMPGTIIPARNALTRFSACLGLLPLFAAVRWLELFVSPWGRELRGRRYAPSADLPDPG